MQKAQREAEQKMAEEKRFGDESMHRMSPSSHMHQFAQGQQQAFDQKRHDAASHQQTARQVPAQPAQAPQQDQLITQEQHRQAQQQHQLERQQSQQAAQSRESLKSPKAGQRVSRTPSQPQMAMASQPPQIPQATVQMVASPHHPQQVLLPQQQQQLSQQRFISQPWLAAAPPHHGGGVLTGQMAWRVPVPGSAAYPMVRPGQPPTSATAVSASHASNVEGAAPPGASENSARHMPQISPAGSGPAPPYRFNAHAAAAARGTVPLHVAARPGVAVDPGQYATRMPLQVGRAIPSQVSAQLMANPGWQRGVPGMVRPQGQQIGHFPPNATTNIVGMMPAQRPERWG